MADTPTDLMMSIKMGKNLLNPVSQNSVNTTLPYERKYDEDSINSKNLPEANRKLAELIKQKYFGNNKPPVAPAKKEKKPKMIYNLKEYVEVEERKLNSLDRHIRLPLHDHLNPPELNIGNPEIVVIPTWEKIAIDRSKFKTLMKDMTLGEAHRGKSWMYGRDPGFDANERDHTFQAFYSSN